MIPSYAHTGTCMFLRLSKLCLALSEMLFTKQEKGQENQASQQKSLSSPKKRTIVLPEGDCSDRDIEDSEVGKSCCICIPIPLLPLPIAFAALLLWNKWPGCAWASALWHHPHRGTALGLALQQHHFSKSSPTPQWWKRDKGTGHGARAQLLGWAT